MAQTDVTVPTVDNPQSEPFSVYRLSDSENTLKPRRVRLHAAALAYARRNIPVFPCIPGGKKPLTKRGFLEATTDPRRINLWWNRWPEANIGIPTGERSGFFAVDVDRDKGGFGSLEDLEAEHGELPETTRVRTGGGGLHLLFACPPCQEIRNSADGIGAGIDVRGEGGYVIAPPSRTERPYEPLEKRPPVEPPEWLLQLLSKPQKAVSQDTRTGSQPTPIMAAGEKIPDGQRNDTLTRIAGRLHDGTRSIERLTADLLEINASRCEPPLPDREVEKIAASIHRRSPAKPSRDVEPEVLEALGGIEAAHLWGREWKGSGWKTPRSVMAVLVKRARKHGRLTKEGNVELCIGVRDIALESGVSKASITRSNGALDKLKGEGVIATVKGSGTRTGTVVLLAEKPSRAKITHSSTSGAPPSSGSTLRAPLSSPRLRYTRPIYERVGDEVIRHSLLRLGKSAEAIVDTLERVGEWMDLADLADELGIKRPRDLRRRVIARLEEAAVVECSGDGVRLRLDWLSALQLRREEDLEIADYERDKRKYERQRENHRNRLEAHRLQRVGMSYGEIAEALEFGIEDVRSILAGSDAAPTRSEMDAAREIREADGFIEDLERIEGSEDVQIDFIDPDEPEPDPVIVAALVRYLDRNPRRRGERPSWLRVAMWADGYLDTRPPVEVVRYALPAALAALKVAA